MQATTEQNKKKNQISATEKAGRCYLEWMGLLSAKPQRGERGTGSKAQRGGAKEEEGERTVRPAREETGAARAEKEKELVGWSESQRVRCRGEDDWRWLQATMLGDDGVFPGARCWQALASACRGLTGGLLGGRYVRENSVRASQKGTNGPPSETETTQQETGV